MRRFAPAALGLLLAACASAPRRLAESQPLAYVPAYDGSLFARHAPVVIAERTEEGYNRIGTPAAALGGGGRESVFVDLSKPTWYVRRQDFKTDEGEYINLIYRFHFERVPFRLFPPTLTAGKNVGLFVIVTLSRSEVPLLVTLSIPAAVSRRPCRPVTCLKSIIPNVGIRSRSASGGRRCPAGSPTRPVPGRNRGPSFSFGIASTA